MFRQYPSDLKGRADSQEELPFSLAIEKTLLAIEKTLLLGLLDRCMDLSIGTSVVYGLPVVKIRPWPWFVGFHSRVTYG